MNRSRAFTSAFSRMYILPLAALAWNLLVYQGAFFLTASHQHFDLSLPIDRSIPLIPWTLLIYFGCFAYWAAHYVFIARRGGHDARKFYMADFFIKAVSFLFFLFLPTVMQRPEVTGTGFWNDAIRFLYKIDKPYNLFPSIHCSVSWLCWISVRKDAQISKWYRCFTLMAAIAVCISTLTTRQHIVLDILGGILTAEICWAATRRLCVRTAGKKLTA